MPSPSTQPNAAADFCCSCESYAMEFPLLRKFCAKCKFAREHFSWWNIFFFWNDFLLRARVVDCYGDKLSDYLACDLILINETIHSCWSCLWPPSTASVQLSIFTALKQCKIHHKNHRIADASSPQNEIYCAIIKHQAIFLWVASNYKVMLPFITRFCVYTSTNYEYRGWKRRMFLPCRIWIKNVETLMRNN